jgi:hypothetical protein
MATPDVFPKRVVFDPTTDFSHNHLIAIQKIGSQVAVAPQTAQSYSNSNIAFNIFINSLESVVDRHIPLQLTLQVSGTGPAPAVGTLLQENQGIWGLRSWPLAQCMTALSLQINNQTFSTQPSLFIKGLQHAYIFQDDINSYLSTSPTLADCFQTYDQGLGRANNPLNSYGNASYWENPRGAFPYTVVVNTPTAWTINFLITEPLLCSPLLISGKTRANGFGSLSQLTINIQLGSLLRAFSYNNISGNALSTLTATIIGTPQVLITQITPNVSEKIPEFLSIPFENVTPYPTQFNAPVSTNSIYTFSSINTIQLNQVPRKVYIWSAQSDSFYSSSSAPFGSYLTDAFSELLSLSITFNNLTGILSSATEQDLYNMTVKNGVHLSWPQWQGTVGSGTTVATGSILCLDFAENIGLPEDLAPGVSEKFNFQIVNAVFRNCSPNTITPTMNVIFCYDGILTLNGTVAYSISPLLTTQDVLAAPTFERMAYKEIRDMYGGDFFSGVKRVFSKVAPIIRGIRGIATPLAMAAFPEYSQQIGTANSALASLGLGGRRTNPVEMRKKQNQRLLR